MINHKIKQNLFLFFTYSYIDARYIKSDNGFLNGKKVEFVPANILRSGVTYKGQHFSSTFSLSALSKQYSDANNTLTTITGNNGIVPSYCVLDWSAKYSYSIYTLGLSLNNIANTRYFTRRSTGYPGPGLIPAEPRIFAISLGLKI